MPIPWLPPTILNSQEPGYVSTKVDQRLTVRARRQLLSVAKQELVFEGDVRATFGVSEVYADKFTVKLDEGDLRRAIADGNVRFVDPEGGFSGDSFEFDWATETGIARRVNFVLEGIEVSADQLTVAPNKWELTSGQLKGCEGPLKFGLKVERLTIEPNKAASLRNFSFQIGGKTILGVPSFQQSLNKQDRGLALPQLRYSGEKGLGIKWDPSKPLDKNTYLSASISAQRTSYPETQLSITRSFAGERGATHYAQPRSELRDPLYYGYLEYIGVPNLVEERATLSEKRNNVTVASSWNQGYRGSDGDVVSKPIEAVYELSGMAGGWGIFSQARLQSIKSTVQATQVRGLIWGSIMAPSLTLSDSLELFARIDYRSATQRDDSLNWARGQVGVVGKLGPAISLSAGYSRAASSGSSPFPFDSLEVDEALHVRGDFDLGSTTFGYLGKYDLDRKQWFDHQFRVSQVVGCLEPFVIVRERPREFSFGILFRPLKAIEEKARRSINRTPGNWPLEPNP